MANKSQWKSQQVLSNDKQQSLVLSVSNTVTYISGYIASETYHALKKVLGYLPEAYPYLLRAVAEKRGYKPKEWYKIKDDWDGTITTICYPGKCRCNIKREGMHFPTGLLTRSREFFDKHNISFVLKDMREVVPKTHIYTMSDEFESREYQKKVVDIACNKGRGIISMATGSGKTGCAANIIANLGVSSFVFYVTSKDLMTQAHDELERFIRLGGNPIKVGMVGAGKFDIQDITVMTVQTAIRALDKKWTRFDDEDDSKEDTTLDDRRKDIKELVMSAKGFFADECVTGDTILITEKGPIPIKDVRVKDVKKVLSYDVNSQDFVWRDILNFWEKGKKKTVKVTLTSRENIVCTEDHVFYTKNGLKQAKDLTSEDLVIICDRSRRLNEKGLSRVRSVNDYGENEVYDIEVEGTHCFFANDILLKNCQHWAAQTCQVISDFSISARHRFAMSATPVRDLSDDILIDACFGKKLADINASYLIRQGFLIRPTIYMVPINNMRGCPFKSYPKIYKQAITDNSVRNQMIANMAVKFVEQGRVVLVLCKHIAHGKMLESLIPGSIFLRGETSSKKRKEHLDKMRRREACITIASVIFDEGIDVRCLDTLILSGSGKSKTRALQRVGRILRPYEGKTDAIVIDFIDNAKHVLSHSRARQTMYESEPEFIIKKMDL